MAHTLRRLRLRRRKKGWGKRLLALAACLGAGAWALLEWGLGSVSPELAQEALRAHALSAVRRSVEEALEEVPAVVNVDRDDAGEAQAVQVDGEALNQLRSQVLASLEEGLEGSASVAVPAGSLTGVALLNGRGFPVRLRMGVAGSADVAFQTEFLSAGVNQSCHRLVMTVRVQAYSQSKRFPAQAEVESSTVLAETVLVGAVPQAALVKSGETKG